MGTPELIHKTDGTPFLDTKSAATQQRILERRGIITKPVELEGGGVVLEVIERQRRNRVPLGLRNVLTAPATPGYVSRFVNDKDGRIEAYQEAGWEVVVDEAKAGDDYVGNSRIPGSAITKPVGKGTTAVLMRKRKDWYDEDMAEKQRQVDANEKGLVSQAKMDNLRPAEGYQEGIKISGSRQG